VYSSFFKLEFTPFRDVTKPDFLWLSEASSVVLQDLEKDLAANSGLFILEGELGTGKSTLATAIANKLSNNFIIADTVDPGTDTLDLFKHIAHAFDLPDTFRSRDEFYKLFQTYLETKKATGKGVLLILDEAQNLDTDKLISITSLTNNTVADADILRILLVARCELIDSMSESEKALLIGDHAKTYSVAPLTLAETSDYITRCLEYAGATHEIFSSEAIQAVHEYSKGILRQINTICDNALLSAFIRETDEITPQIIHQAAYKFGLAPSLEIEKPDHEEPDQRPAADTVAIDPPESRSWQVLGGAFLALIILCGIFFYTNSSKLYEAADVTGNEKTTITANDAVPAGKQESTTSVTEMSTISNSDNKPNDTLPAAEELVPNSLPHIAAQKKKVILSITAK